MRVDHERMFGGLTSKGAMWAIWAICFSVLQDGHLAFKGAIWAIWAICASVPLMAHLLFHGKNAIVNLNTKSTKSTKSPIVGTCQGFLYKST